MESNIKWSFLWRQLLILIALCLIGMLTANELFASDQPMDLSAQNARIFNTQAGKGLTLPSQAAPASVVAEFLHAQRHGERTLDSLITVKEYRVERTGLTHLRLEQEVSGLKVYGTYVKAALNNKGELVHLIEKLAPPPAGGVLPSLIDAHEALNAALNRHHPEAVNTLHEVERSDNTVAFSTDGFFFRNPTVTRVAIAMANGSMQEGFLVETWSGSDNLLHHTLVAGNGRILGVQLRTNTDSYNIFPDHPGNSTQTVKQGPGTSNAESPAGWLFDTNTTQFTTNISGNNVHAYLDTDNNNIPDDLGSSTVTGGSFETSADLLEDPSILANQEVATQNLFYFNNVIHDKLYSHGFVEGAGNFQEDNFGNGGIGNDSVNAEGQDGGGTNNANFATPSDGSNPRMQMYLWTQSTPKRDGDLDSDIIWHEYGHGLTWRMIGNMSGPISGAIGEGMSDVLSILINDNDVVGEYSYNRTGGIRSAPYTDYPRTYGDFTGSSVHYDGEIYAATIWKLWDRFQDPDNDPSTADGISQDTLLDYVVGGMNFTPAGPAFEDMRDGILQAADVSEHKCLVWEAFAAFGIGDGARGRVKGGGPFGGGKVTVTESFGLPAECDDGGGGSDVPPPGGALVVTVKTDRNNYFNREKALITATVTDGADSVAQASVHIIVETTSGRSLACDPTTNGSGVATCEYKVNTKRDGTGTFDVSATASKGGYKEDSDTTTFTVE